MQVKKTISQVIIMQLQSLPCIRYYFMIICLLSLATARSQGIYIHETIDSRETVIHYMIQKKEIARIAIRKAPLFHFYIFHTLYVLPEYRNGGIGKNLLEYACKYVKTQGASRIYIQPGPFELDEQGCLIKPTAQYDERMDKLLTLYRKCGFTAASKSLTYCAYLLYTCMRIDEDSAHLMVHYIVD